MSLSRFTKPTLTDPSKLPWPMALSFPFLVFLGSLRFLCSLIGSVNQNQERGEPSLNFFKMKRSKCQRHNVKGGQEDRLDPHGCFLFDVLSRGSLHGFSSNTLSQLLYNKLPLC